MPKRYGPERYHRAVQYGGMVLAAIIVGGLIGYQIKLLMRATQPATHAMAVPWSAFDEGYKALVAGRLIHRPTLQQLLAMEGKRIVVYGYMLPITMGERHAYFLLTSTSLACQFCYPTNLEHVIEVTMKEAIPYSRQTILLSGIFSIDDAPETGVIYYLDDADYVPE